MSVSRRLGAAGHIGRRRSAEEAQGVPGCQLRTPPRRRPTPSSVPGLIRSIAHRLAGDEVEPAGRGSPGAVRRRDRLAQLGAADARGASRPGRPGRLLDLHLHQLAADAPLSSGHGPPSTRTPGLTIVGVHTPEFGFEQDVDNIVAAVARLRGRVSDRDRQRLRRLARLRQPLLAGALPRRRRGTDPVPPLRRGRVRHDRDGDPAAPARRRRGRRRPGPRRRSTRRASRSRPTGGRCSRPRRTPGTGQATGFAQDDVARFDEPLAYTAPARLPLNDWALAGTWTVAGHAAVLERARRRGSRSSSTPATSTS